MAAAAAAVIPRQPTSKRNHRAPNKNGKWPSLTEMAASQAPPHPRPARRKTTAAPTRRRWRTTTTIQAAIHRKMLLARITTSPPAAFAGVAVAVAHGNVTYCTSNLIL